jgi:hypothetical protein
LIFFYLAWGNHFVEEFNATSQYNHTVLASQKMLMVLSKGYNKYIPQSRTVFESNYTFNSTLVRDLDTVSTSVEYIVGKTSVPLQINGYRYDNTDIRSLNFINTITGHKIIN